VPDDLLKACAAGGGVIGINGIAIYLGSDDLVQRMIDHIDYVAELVGIEHVGLGLDYMYDLDTVIHRTELFNDAYPSGQGYDAIKSIKMLAPEEYPQIGEALLDRGYSVAETTGVLGENFMRVCEVVWRGAR
jgi:membrane dipeptidase